MKTIKIDCYQNHPLMMEPVLQILFEYLNVSDFKICRLINTVWDRKAFKFLKEKSKVKLVGKAREDFLSSSSETQRKFNGFAFEVQDWDEEISKCLQTYVSPKTLRVTELSLKRSRYYQTNEGKMYEFKVIEDLLRSQHNRLVHLGVTVWDGWIWIIPEDVRNLEFPALTTLELENTTSYEIPDRLWLIMIENSPNLKHLKAFIASNTFWEFLPNNIPNGLESLCVIRIRPQIINSIKQIPSINLKTLEIQFDPGETESCLRKLSHSLEKLIFHTPPESALSPLTFPLMPKLKILNSGNSQLSFPSILQKSLSSLEELQVTYWDWVWTFEQLPHRYYYWMTDDPHPGVKRIEIRFPDLTEIRGMPDRNYVVMENFSDFCDRITIKFPSLDTIRLRNVWMQPCLNDWQTNPGHKKIKFICESFGPRLKELSVKDYYVGPGLSVQSQEIMTALNETCTDIKILDLNPKEWLKIWKGNSHDQLSFENTSLYLHSFKTITIAKLIFIPGLRLTKLVEQLSGLQHLEIIGDKCIDRLDRYKMKKTCSSLTYFYQHPCKCSGEDSWYMSQDLVFGSHQVFQKLFGEFVA